MRTGATTRNPRTRGAAVLGALTVAAVAACTPSGEGSPGSAASSSTAAQETDALDVAVNDPQEDSLYPDVGDPGVDALSYDLDLTWDPDTSTLEAAEILTFRATADSDDFQLDLSETLAVASITVDGESVEFDHTGKNLVVTSAVTADERYQVDIDYSGSPEPVPVPTARTDFNTTGWTVTDTGETWTMQEPFGAYSWYAVNDHPSDKAFYDFTLTVPDPLVGVANGELVSRETTDGQTTTRWSLGDPAASYLVTVALGDFTVTDYESASGIPITTWLPTDRVDSISGPETAPAAMDWLEDKLGPYPFDTFGIVVVDSQSGMETQTMVTLGDTSYTTSPAVVLHELVHQWYGNTVTPNDWRDLWMNEGMAMYLQGWWEAEQEGISVQEKMDFWASFEDEERDFAGPPAAADIDKFGSGNVYYSPALMWHELRTMIGEEAFLDLIRAWPAERVNTTSDREDFLGFIEERTGEELSDFFDAWLLGEKTPPRPSAA